MNEILANMQAHNRIPQEKIWRRTCPSFALFWSSKSPNWKRRRLRQREATGCSQSGAQWAIHQVQGDQIGHFENARNRVQQHGDSVQHELGGVTVSQLAKSWRPGKTPFLEFRSILQAQWLTHSLRVILWHWINHASKFWSLFITRNKWSLSITAFIAIPTLYSW